MFIRVRVVSITGLSGAGYSSGGKFRFRAECTKKFIIFDELVAQTRIVKKSGKKNSVKLIEHIKLR